MAEQPLSNLPGDVSYQIVGATNSNNPASFPFVAEHTFLDAPKSHYNSTHNTYAPALDKWVDPLKTIQQQEAKDILEPYARPLVQGQAPYLDTSNSIKKFSCTWNHPESIDDDPNVTLLFRA
ncbi:hypothetical protein RI054_06g35170 [Pseudoscourfieldia marina]